MSVYDRRLTAARPDLAAAHLEGHVAADRYVTGDRRRILTGLADVRRAPRPDAPLETQAIHGETVVLYEADDEGWGWVQLETDGYVGYVAAHAIGGAPVGTTHVVAVKRTFVYPISDMKQPVLMALPLGAHVTVDGVDGAYAHMAHGGYVFSQHLAPRDSHVGDFVAVAEHLTDAPYLWGGRSPQGIDCSGLVQLALARAGFAAPRDTDMQQSLGEPVSFDRDLSGLRRGDLIFWRGHVGIMRDATNLIHANAHHMLVASEPLKQAADRIFRNSQADVAAIRRITKT